jgi:hypothetical protein
MIRLSVSDADMRKAAVAVLVSALLFSAIAGTQFINLGKANPISEIEYKTPPIISIRLPVDNYTFSVNRVLLNFTVTKPDSWLIHGGYEAQQNLKSVSYQLDGKYYDEISVKSSLESPFDYSVNLTNLTDGAHTLKVYAYASGWVIEMHGLWEYEVPINSSSTVYFNVDANPPKITILPFENKTQGTLDVPLIFTLDEPTSKISYSLDGQDNVTVTGNTTLTDLSNGDHTVTAYAIDTAGHTGVSETFYFSVKEPFPTTLIATVSGASIAAIVLGLLVYFKRRRREAAQV